MPTVVAATVAASEMICRGENHEPIGIKIIISWNYCQRSGRRLFTVVRHHAGAAEADAIARLYRDTREQNVRNVHGLTPARAFVSGSGAKPTIIGPAAQWTARGVDIHWR